MEFIKMECAAERRHIAHRPTGRYLSASLAAAGCVKPKNLKNLRGEVPSNFCAQRARNSSEPIRTPQSRIQRARIPLHLSACNVIIY